MKPRTPTSGVGKRVGGALYLHKEAIDTLGEADRQRLEKATAIAPDADWNVAKIQRGGVSLLRYESFDEAPFPALLTATTIDLASGACVVRDYSARPNRPILHRKELLLREDDPRQPQFAALTRAAEERGLFAESTRIGTQAQWKRVLDTAGVEVRGQRLVNKDAIDIDVARHRTALSRRTLSQPVALMVRLGLLDKERSFFDYGCGQGDDVSILSVNGFEAAGWDPHYAPEAPRREADVVNLGYVLNVIEDAHEREETLAASWRYARRVLTVAVMTMSSMGRGSARQAYEDGVLTRRGTFQRYFSHNELRDFVQRVTGQAPVTLSPGIVSVFRDKELEQEAMFRRRSRALLFLEDSVLGFVAPARERALAPPRPDIRERIELQLKEIWQCCLALGRAPLPSELPASVLQHLEQERIAPVRAINVCLNELADMGELEAAAAARREDLIVHFALSLFPGAPRYASLPESIRRDVKTFFSSHSAMLAEAKTSLFALGGGKVVSTALEQMVSQGLAGWRGKKVRMSADVAPRAPQPIRLLIGCGEILEPDLASADCYDIYPDGGRMRALWCEDFAARAPVLREMSDIVFSGLKARRRSRAGEVLYGKGAFLAHDHPDRDAQLEFDRRVVDARLVNETWDGPSAEDLARLGSQMPWLFC
jgi:DNA phosphorothioation-associated putative methyltransferase